MAHPQSQLYLSEGRYSHQPICIATYGLLKIHDLLVSNSIRRIDAEHVPGEVLKPTKLSI